MRCVRLMTLALDVSGGTARDNIGWFGDRGMALLNAALVVGAVFVTVTSGVALWMKAVAEEQAKSPFLGKMPPVMPAWTGGSGKVELEISDDQTAISELERGIIGQMSGVKRLIDCAASLCLLVVLSPVLLLTAIAIKLDSAGPVLYRQKRIGYRGECFEVLKFRSMVSDAEKDGPQYAKSNDNRVTRVGRFIRKTRIDEIPQAINVLRGEMSFVGPRPERPEFAWELEREIPQYNHRHLVKPGITGWAQVKYEYTATVEGAREKLRFDLFYIRHFSPILDIVIILMTVRVALFGIGSR